MNLKDPSTAAYTAMVLSFLLYTCLLNQMQPQWVMVIDRSGLPVTSTRLVMSFAATFSFVTAAAVLLVMSQRRDGNSTNDVHLNGRVNTYNSGTSFVPTFYAFCN